ncbi:hypothetical protein [Chryseobacterium jejuense]|uniref:Uncharacterized protein n=1 Tax=Chryseobacterium jejuense TaxID=445960 RepID=A0A2X2Z5Q0_CHRJE|nr:hypothetical protein [Chryseobacterium jejuense]SDJ34592.1 hypothetical protein SAMN05421542_3255 [Chryseobacterium jejuense]SQB45760.1 Uncharacterised protein [Chryseobacterium jejuense]
MKKFLLTATMLVAFTALSQAQQGRVGINTTTPAATLDVVASTDATRPDALLVPRLSRADLEARTAAYADGNATAASAQNGALVFINALGGAGTGKTVNVTATGFYYYDGTNGNNVWKPVGGGGADTSIYLNDGTLGGPRTVTQANNNLTFTTGTGQFVVNGTNNVKGAQFMNIRVDNSTTVTIQPNDYMIHWTGAAPGTVTLPTAASSAGRELCFFSENDVLNTGALGNGGNVNAGFGTCIISNGVIWITKNSF